MPRSHKCLASTPVAVAAACAWPPPHAALDCVRCCFKMADAITRLLVAPSMMSAVTVPCDSLGDVVQRVQQQRLSCPPPPAPNLQSTGCVLMVAPVYAAFNDDCAGDNHCHAGAHDSSQAADDAAACMREFTSCVTALRLRGVNVWVHVPDDNIVTPDAHFPNNWI